MGLTKSEFGRMLVAKLESSADSTALSKWAYQTYLVNSRNLEPGLKDVLLDLARMEDGPEFEYTVTELSDLANALASGGR